MTADQAITRALKKIGVVAAGETPGGNDASDGYDALRIMLDSWKAQRLVAYKVERYQFPITANVASYALGPSQTWSVPSVPLYIDHAAAVDTTLTIPSEVPLEVYTPQRWETYLTQKTQVSSQPYAIYYQRGAAAGTVKIWPVVTNGAQALALYLVVQLAQFPDRTTDVTLLPGYEEAIIYNLAIRLCPDHGRQPDGLVLQGAAEGLALIKRSNPNMDEMAVDAALLSGSRPWDWITGQ